MEKWIKIFVWTYTNPANWKWYNLLKSSDLEILYNLINDWKEYLVSDIDTLLSLPQERHIKFYLDIQELINKLNDDEFIIAWLLLNKDLFNAQFNSVEDFNEKILDSNYFSYDMTDINDIFNDVSNLKYSYIIQKIEDWYFWEDLKQVLEAWNVDYLDFGKLWNTLYFNNVADLIEFNWQMYILE